MGLKAELGGFSEYMDKTMLPTQVAKNHLDLKWKAAAPLNASILPLVVDVVLYRKYGAKSAEQGTYYDLYSPHLLL